MPVRRERSAELRTAIATIANAAYAQRAMVAYQEYLKLSKDDQQGLFVASFDSFSLPDRDVFISKVLTSEKPLPLAAFLTEYLVNVYTGMRGPMGYEDLPTTPLVQLMRDSKNYWIIDLILIHYSHEDRRTILPELTKFLANAYCSPSIRNPGLIEAYLCKLIDKLSTEDCITCGVGGLFVAAFQNNADELCGLISGKRLISKEDMVRCAFSLVRDHKPTHLERLLNMNIQHDKLLADGFKQDRYTYGYGKDLKKLEVNQMFDSNGCSLMDATLALYQDTAVQEIFRVLLRNGYDVNLRNKRGESILETIASNSRTEIKPEMIQQIFARGLKLDATHINAKLLPFILQNWDKCQDLGKLTNPESKKSLLDLIFTQPNDFIWRYSQQITKAIHYIRENCPEQIYSQDPELESPIFNALRSDLFTKELMEFKTFDPTRKSKYGATCLGITTSFGRFSSALQLAKLGGYSAEDYRAALGNLVGSYPEGSDYLELLTMLIPLSGLADDNLCNDVLTRALNFNNWIAAREIFNAIKITNSEGNVLSIYARPLVLLLENAFANKQEAKAIITTIEAQYGSLSGLKTEHNCHLSFLAVEQLRIEVLKYFLDNQLDVKNTTNSGVSLLETLLSVSTDTTADHLVANNKGAWLLSRATKRFEALSLLIGAGASLLGSNSKGKLFIESLLENPLFTNNPKLLQKILADLPASEFMQCLPLIERHAFDLAVQIIPVKCRALVEDQEMDATKIAQLEATNKAPAASFADILANKQAIIRFSEMTNSPLLEEGFVHRVDVVQSYLKAKFTI